MNPQIPLVISTMCQRLSMGMFVMAVVAAHLFGLAVPLRWIAFISLVVLALGMLGTMGHLGKKNRVLNAFSNLKSDIAQEAIWCVVVITSYFVVGVQILFEVPETAALVAEAIGVAASAAFIWITAKAYQIKARPAWASALTPAVFCLTFLGVGGLGALFFAALYCSSDPGFTGMLILVVAIYVCALASQAIYVNYVGHVGYRIDVNPLDAETHDLFIGWVALGVVVPIVCLIVLSIAPTLWAFSLAAVLSEALSLLCWQAFFFVCGKEVWYFPQYEKDLSPNYF